MSPARSVSGQLRTNATSQWFSHTRLDAQPFLRQNSARGIVQPLTDHTLKAHASPTPRLALLVTPQPLGTPISARTDQSALTQLFPPGHIAGSSSQATTASRSPYPSAVPRPGAHGSEDVVHPFGTSEMLPPQEAKTRFDALDLNVSARLAAQFDTNLQQHTQLFQSKSSVTLHGNNSTPCRSQRKIQRRRPQISVCSLLTLELQTLSVSS